MAKAPVDDPRMLSLGQLSSLGPRLLHVPAASSRRWNEELGWSRSSMFGALVGGLLTAGLCSHPPSAPGSIAATVAC